MNAGMPQPCKDAAVHQHEAMNSSLLALLSAGLVLSSARVFAESPGGKILLSEDFESTQVGQIPAGFTKSGAVGVVDDVAHSGKHSLRMEAAEKGGRKITKSGPEIAAIGGEHWGRLYYKVKLPVPLPVIPEGKTSGIIHSTLVSGTAASPLGTDSIEVRPLGHISKADGTFNYLYNVQPKGGRAEFAFGAKSRTKYTDDWVLVEWYVSYETQAYRFFIDGKEIPEMAKNQGAGNFAGLEIPKVFESLSFGWTNYQAAQGEGFTAWMDDIAIGKERLGPVGGKVAAK